MYSFTADIKTWNAKMKRKTYQVVMMMTLFDCGNSSKVNSNADILGQDNFFRRSVVQVVHESSLFLELDRPFSSSDFCSRF